MLTSPDFKDLLKLFEKHKARYLVIGGYAVMKYSGRPQDKIDVRKLKKAGKLKEKKK